MKSWIGTFSGRVFDLAAPTLEAIDTVDVAHALSMLCRFNGHCREFYSVAEHSVRVSYAIEDDLRAKVTPLIEREVLSFAGLLHDAAEAYTGDVTTPLKNLIRGPFHPIEVHIEDAIGAVYFLPIGKVSIVKHFDAVLFATEARDLMPKGLPYTHPDGVAPLDCVINPWTQAVAKARWLARFDELGGKR